MTIERPNKKLTSSEAPKGQQAEQQPAAPGGSVAADRAWAQNRIGNFFKAQQAGRIQRKPQDGTIASGKGNADLKAAAKPPGAQTLADACRADPGIAKQKYEDVMNEVQPRAVAARPQFIAGATERLHEGHKPLDAMRSEVSKSGQKYLCLGSLVPEQIITGSGGVSRVLDLPSLFNNGYLNQAFVIANAIRSSEAFLSCVREGKFQPSRDMKEDAPLRGKTEETWWFPSSAANAANLEKLRLQLYIHQDLNYSHGAVRLDMPQSELKAHRIELFKPTSFDGMMQGWEGDAWWKHSQDPHWGLTKNNTYEAVMKMLTLEHFKGRSLIMPTMAAAGAEGTSHGTATHSKAQQDGNKKHG